MTENQRSQLLELFERAAESLCVHGSDDGPSKPEPIPLPEGFIELHLLNCADQLSAWHVAVESIAGYGPNVYRKPAYKLETDEVPLRFQ